MMELGFVEEAEDPKELTSPFFPSKVGGKPAWLDLVRLPSVETLSCRKCGKPLIHLLQIQSSSSSSGNQEHHRTLFLFLCAAYKCHSPGDTSCFMALRCEMRGEEVCDNGSFDHITESHDTTGSKERGIISRDSNASDNTLFSSSATEDTSNTWRKELTTPLCLVCGGHGPKHCGSCKCVHYCCRDHQVHDWKAGHKCVCHDLTEGKSSLETLDYDPSVGVVLPELEIVTELEPASCREEKERSEEERIKEYLKYVEEGRGKVEEVGKVEELEELEKAATAGEKKDKLFRMFKKRISAEPTQVSRDSIISWYKVLLCGRLILW